MTVTRIISEEDFTALLANMQRKDDPILSRDGVKEHTASCGRGGGAVTERQQPNRTDGTTVKSSARTSHATKRLYDSKWEAAYHAKLQLEIQAGLVKQVWLHPFSLWLPGGIRYKPDFMVQYPDGLERRLEIIEVKGWSKNRRDGITRLKIAAALFPCFVWRMVYKTTGGGWDGEYL